MGVQGGQHDERVPASRRHQAAQGDQGRGQVTPVDGVGELPRGDGARLAEERRHLLDADTGALAVGGGQHVEERGQPADVVAQVFADQVGGGGVEAHRTLLQLGAEPHATVPARRHPGVDDMADPAHRVAQRARDLPSPADEHEPGGGKRIGQVGHQRPDLGGEEPADLAGDDDPVAAEEGRRLGGVDHGPQLALGPEVLDHQGGVVVADQLGHERPDGITRDARVVALDQVGRKGGRGLGRRHASASRMAAMARHTRRVPRTSWALTIRQPRVTPSAVADNDASPRWVMSRPRMTPRNVLLDADSSSGYPR